MSAVLLLHLIVSPGGPSGAVRWQQSVACVVHCNLHIFTFGSKSEQSDAPACCLSLLPLTFAGNLPCSKQEGASATFLCLPRFFTDGPTGAGRHTNMCQDFLVLPSSMVFPALDLGKHDGARQVAAQQQCSSSVEVASHLTE